MALTAEQLSEAMQLILNDPKSRAAVKSGIDQMERAEADNNAQPVDLSKMTPHELMVAGLKAGDEKKKTSGNMPVAS